MEQWVLDLMGSPWVYAALLALATIDGFFPPVPSESVVIALATSAMATGRPELWVVVVVAAIGAWCGDQIAYTIGTRVRVRDLRIFSGRRAQAALGWAEGTLQRRGAAFIVAARYVPVGRVAVNMTAGALGFPRRRFMALTALAAVLWAVYSTVIGIGAGAWLHDSPVLAVAVGVVGGLVLGVVIDWLVRRWSSRRDRAARLAGTTGPAGAAPAVEAAAAPDGDDLVTGRSRSATRG